MEETGGWKGAGGKGLLKMNRRQEVQLQWTPPDISRISQQVVSIITSLSAFKKLA